ncbi:MAG: hypothetical protein ACK5L3_06670 [Oscillospiraceae bacterium]
MNCLMDENKEVDFPCFRGCPLFGDCVCNYEKKWIKEDDDSSPLIFSVKGLRPCEVNGRPARFHCWSTRARVVAPSMLRGGHQGGQLSETFAIIEYEDGEVSEEYPYKIRFR